MQALAALDLRCEAMPHDLLKRTVEIAGYARCDFRAPLAIERAPRLEIVCQVEHPPGAIEARRAYRVFRTEGGFRITGRPPVGEELEAVLKSAGVRAGDEVELGDEVLEWS